MPNDQPPRAATVPSQVAPVTVPERMRAWIVTGRPGIPGRLALVKRPVPEPGPDEVLVRVEVCGV